MPCLPRYPAELTPRLRRLLLGTTALLPVASPALAQAPGAMPTGGTVSAGAAAISQSGNRTQITQTTSRAAIDWQRFDVGANASVNFTQPSANAWTLNRVAAGDPSMIAGRVTANGGVAIVNPSGVVFAAGAQVNVGSLIATTSNISTPNFMAGRMVFDGTPEAGARVENRGTITVADRGLAALVAPGVANSGVIRARLGSAVLAGAESFRLDLAGDGLLSIDVTQAVRRAPDGATALVTNSGVVEAQGGQVVLTAHAASGLVEAVVRNTGRVRADGGRAALTGAGGNVEITSGSVTARGGAVEVAAAGAAVTVGAQARVSASGRAGGGTVQLGGATTGAVRVEGRVTARGTRAGATGGRVAAQATESVTIAAGGVLDASGQAGGGTVLVGSTGVGTAQTMARVTVVEAGAAVRADATAAGNGGTVVVNSTERTSMLGDVSARGGARAGDGGFVEISGQGRLTLDLARVDVRAGAGVAGTVLLDPDRILITTATPTNPDTPLNAIPVGGVVTTDNANANTLYINPTLINAFGTNLTLQAQQRVEVDATGGINKPTGGLTLQSGAGGIVINAPIALSSTSNLTFITTGALSQGANAILTANAVIASAQSINLGEANNVGALNTLTTGSVNFRSIFATGLALNGVDAGANPGAGNVTLTGDQGLIVNGPIRGNDLFLNSSGAIAGAGTLTGNSVSLRGSTGGSSFAGSVNLSGGNLVGTLDALASGNISYQSAGALIVNQAVTTGGDVTLRGTTSISLPNAISLGRGSAAGGYVLITPRDANTDLIVAAADPAPLPGLWVRPGQLQTAVRSPTGTLSLQSSGTGVVTVTNALAAPTATLELSGSTINANADLSAAGATSTVRLFAGAALAIDPAALVTANTVLLAPNSADANITLAGVGATGLSVTSASLNRLRANELIVGGTGLNVSGGVAFNTGSIDLAGILAVQPATALADTTLRLRAGGSVTQSGGTITATNLAGYANGATPNSGNFLLSAGNATGPTTGNNTITGNAITNIIADNGAGTDGIRARGDLRIDTNVPMLTVQAPVRVGDGRQLTLLANDLTVDTTGSLLAPGGIIQLQPFSTRGVTLGGTVANTLSLDAGELGRIDGSGGASRLRIGGPDVNTVSNIAVAGATDLGLRLGTLELRADNATGTITGAGVITVPGFSALAGGEIDLSGAHAIGMLAPLTNTPGLVGATNAAIWAGAGNVAGGPVAGGVRFVSAGNLAVNGSVLSSGVGNVSLTTNGGGTLDIAATRWVAAEAGTVTVTAAGALTNLGTIVAAPIASNIGPGSLVSSGAGGLVGNTGTIALGQGVASSITGITVSSGLLLADTVSGLTTNSGTVIAGGIGGLAVGTAFDNQGTVQANLNLLDRAVTNSGTIRGSVFAGGIVNSGTIVGAAVEADGTAGTTGVVVNTGTIRANAIRGQNGVDQNGGTLSGSVAGATTIASFSITGAEVRTGALGASNPPQAGTAPGVAGVDGSLTIEATTGNITQTGGIITAAGTQSVSFTARLGDVRQTGNAGSITAPSIAASAAGNVLLGSTGNSFGRVIAWASPPVFTGGPAAAIPLTTLGTTPDLSGYGVGAGTGNVLLSTTANSLAVDAGIRAGRSIDVRLLSAGANLAVNAPIRSGTAAGPASTAGTTLIADNMAIGAAVLAPDATIQVRTLTAGRDIALGNNGVTGLLLDTAELALFGAGTAGPTARLRIGDDAAGAIAITGNVDLRGRVGVLELASDRSIIQSDSTSIDVAGIAARAGTATTHDLRLHDGLATNVRSANRIDEVVRGSTDGTVPTGANSTLGVLRDGLTAGGDIALTTGNNLLVATDARIIADSNPPGVVGGGIWLRAASTGGTIDNRAAITARADRSLTLIADDLSVSAALTGREVRLMPFSGARNVTLGADDAVLGTTLALNTGELGLINASSVLRVGRANPLADGTTAYTALNGNTVGNIAVSGVVGLGAPRVGALELFADSATGTITGTGPINVASLSGIAGGAINLAGGNTVTTVGPITDSYVLASPFTGTGVGLPVTNTALWSGAGNARGGTPASDLTFNNSGPLTITGSVLASGSGNVEINNAGSVTVGSSTVGSIVPWVAAEGGTVSLAATGAGATLVNNGNIAAGVVGTGTVSAAGDLTNRGVIAGVRTVSGANVSNEAPGYISAGEIVADAGTVTNTGTVVTSSLRGVTGLNIGYDINDPAAANYDLSAAAIRIGALTPLALPATRAAGLPGSGTQPLDLVIQATAGNITQTAGTIAAARSVTLTAGTGGAGETFTISQTGGRITAPELAAQAGGDIRLAQPGNSFGTIRPWSSANHAPGTAALADLLQAPTLAGYGIASRAGTVLLNTTGSLVVNGGIRAGGGIDVRLLNAGATLTANGALRSGTIAAAPLTLVADNMTLNAVAGGMTLAAPGSTIQLRSLRPGLGITLGGTGDGSQLTLDSAELARIGGTGPAGTTSPTARLRIGADDAGAISITGNAVLRDRVSALELVSGAGITQSPGTGINVAGIAARAGTGAAANLLLHDGAAHGAASANAIDQVVSGTTDGTVAAGATSVPGTVRNGLTAGGDIALTTRNSLAINAGAAIVAGGDATLRVAGGGGMLAVNAPVSVGSGRSMTLVADDLALAASLSAPSGFLRLMPFTADRAVTLGAGAAGTLAVDPAELGLITASTLRIGRASPTADAGTAYTALNGNTVGSIAVAGAVDLRGRVGTLELFAIPASSSLGGTIAGNGTINVANLAGIASGAVNLGGANTVSRLARITDAYTIASPAFSDTTLAGLTPGSTAFWAGAGAARGGTQPGGFVFNNNTGGPGSVDLTVAGTVLSSGTGAVSLTNAGGIQVSSGSWIAAERGTVSVIALGGGVIGNSGQIVSGDLSGGTVSALSLSNLGTIALGRSAGRISAGGISNSGFLLADEVAGDPTTGNPAIGNLAAGRIVAREIRASTLSNAGVITGSTLTVGSTISNAADLAVGTITAGGALTNTGRITASAVTAGSLDNQAGGSIVAGTASNSYTLPASFRASALSATQLTVPGSLTTRPEGSLSVTTTTGDLANAGTISAAAGLTLSAAQDLRNAGTLTAGDVLRLLAGRDVLQTGGSLSAASLGAAGLSSSAGRDFRLTEGSVTLPTIRAVSAGNELNIRVTSGPVVVAGNLSAGGALRLDAGAGALSLGAIGVTSSAADLTLATTGALSATGSTLTSRSGTTRLSAGGGMSIAGTTFNANSAVLTADGGSTTITGTRFDITGSLEITAANNGLTLRSVTANVDRLTFDAGRDLSVDGGNLTAANLARLVAGTNLTLSTAPITAKRAELVAGNPSSDSVAPLLLRTGGSTFRIGEGLLLSARGGVDATATVLAQSADSLPLTIIDTRLGVFLSQLPGTLTGATTDRPNLPGTAQAWQVSGPLIAPGQQLFGVNDGAPTPPTAAAAGAVTLNLRAGTDGGPTNAPVFLLLNGGTATGTINAGRLGVFGLPGPSRLAGDRAVDLTGVLGTLSQVDGVGAARFGQLAGSSERQPPLAANQQFYRINNCVIGTINCVVPTTQLLPPLTLNNSFELRGGTAREDDTDVLLPNVGERDY